MGWGTTPTADYEVLTALNYIIWTRVPVSTADEAIKEAYQANNSDIPILRRNLPNGVSRIKDTMVFHLGRKRFGA